MQGMICLLDVALWVATRLKCKNWLSKYTEIRVGPNTAIYEHPTESIAQLQDKFGMSSARQETAGPEKGPT